MEIKRIAKNLLRNRVCQNCEWDSRSKCYFYDRGEFSSMWNQDFPKENTCENWTEPSYGHKGGKENYV